MVWLTDHPNWHLGNTHWWLLGTLAPILAALAIAGAMRWQHSRMLLDREIASAMLVSSASPSAARHAGADRAADFVSTLPAVADAQALLQSIRLVLSQQQTTLRGLQVQVVPAEPAQLQRTEVVLRAQGSYKGLKQMLSDLNGRYPDMTVSRLKMRSTAGDSTGVLELDAVLLFWAQPALTREPPGKS